MAAFCERSGFYNTGKTNSGLGYYQAYIWYGGRAWNTTKYNQNRLSNCVWWHYWTLQEIGATEKSVTYSKGTTQYTNITDTNSNTYPTNGASGSYWYVYKGIQ